MLYGLPGGSPGPDAEASGRAWLFMLLFGLVVAGLLSWLLFGAARWAATVSV